MRVPSAKETASLLQRARAARGEAAAWRARPGGRSSERGSTGARPLRASERSTVAARKPAKSGCGRFGRERNSGWNCEPQMRHRLGQAVRFAFLGLGYVLILGIYLPPARSSRGSWQFPSHGDGKRSLAARGEAALTSPAAR